MNKEKDFFKTCFNTVAGLEVRNQSQAIAKEVVLSEIENLQQENKQLKANYERLYNENCKLREEHNINDISLLDENYRLKDNWNKLKEYLINDINNRNGNRVVEYEKGGKIVEYEDSRKVIEIISPIYTLMEDKSKTMKEVLDKMQELEQGSDSNE